MHVCVPQDRKKARYTKLRQMIEAAEQRSDWTGPPRTDLRMRIDLRDSYVLARPTTDNPAPADLASVLKSHFTPELIRANTIPEEESSGHGALRAAEAKAEPAANGTVSEGVESSGNAQGS